MSDVVDPVLFWGRRTFTVAGSEGHILANAFRVMMRERKLISDRLEAEAARASALEAEMRDLKERLALANKWMFGVKSERAAVPPPAEAPQANQSAAEPAAESAAGAARKAFKVIQGGRAGRRPLPSSVARLRHEYVLAGEDRKCQNCHCDMTEIGEETSETVTVIPAKYIAHVIARKKYVCRGCGLHRTAPGPQGTSSLGSQPGPEGQPEPAGEFVPVSERQPEVNVFPGSTYGSPSFIAHVLAYKYWLGMPLYRQELMMDRRGLAVSRTTLANLGSKCGELLTPVVAAFHSDLLGQYLIHADETTTQVLHELGRTAETLSYLWAYRSGQFAEHPVVIFDYQETRAGKHAKRFLTREDGSEFDGFLQVDAYAGYNVLAAPRRVGCWAHARRYFVEAMVDIPAEKKAASPPGQALEFIQQLYAIEHEARGLSPAGRGQLRRRKAAPVLSKLRMWLDEHQPKTARRSLLGKAIGYASKEWDHLSVYLSDGRIDIDNNHCERAIKHVVIGRKNWLFSDSSAGAFANATIYSVVVTAMANGIDPEWYITELLKRLPQMRRAEEVQALMPWHADMRRAWEAAKLPLPNAA